MILSLFNGADLRADGRRLADFHPVVATFGSVRLDLRQALLGGGSNNLSVLALFGSADLLLPAETGVYVEGMSIFGVREVHDQKDGGIVGFGDFEMPGYREAAERINLTVFSIFGNVKVLRAPAPATVMASEPGAA